MTDEWYKRSSKSGSIKKDPNGTLDKSGKVVRFRMSTSKGGLVKSSSGDLDRYGNKIGEETSSAESSHATGSTSKPGNTGKRPEPTSTAKQSSQPPEHAPQASGLSKLIKGKAPMASSSKQVEQAPPGYEHITSTPRNKVILYKTKAAPGGVSTEPSEEGKYDASGLLVTTWSKDAKGWYLDPDGCYTKEHKLMAWQAREARDLERQRRANEHRTLSQRALDAVPDSRHSYNTPLPSYKDPTPGKIGAQHINELYDERGQPIVGGAIAMRPRQADPLGMFNNKPPTYTSAVPDNLMPGLPPINEYSTNPARNPGFGGRMNDGSSDTNTSSPPVVRRGPNTHHRRTGTSSSSASADNNDLSSSQGSNLVFEMDSSPNSKGNASSSATKKGKAPAKDARKSRKPKRNSDSSSTRSRSSSASGQRR